MSGYNQGFSDGYNAANNTTGTTSGSLADVDWTLKNEAWLLTKALWIAPVLLAFTLPWGFVWGLFGIPGAYGAVIALAPDWTKGVRKWTLWAIVTAAIVGANLAVNGVWY